MTEELPVPRCYLSQSDIARAAGVTTGAAHLAIVRGVLTPDVRVGGAPGFSPNDPAVKAYIARERRK